MVAAALAHTTANMTHVLTSDQQAELKQVFDLVCSILTKSCHLFETLWEQCLHSERALMTCIIAIYCGFTSLCSTFCAFSSGVIWPCCGRSHRED